MIDLDKERIAFDEEFGVSNFNILQTNDENLNDSLVLKCNWMGWKKCAESKQAEIDELKSQLDTEKSLRSMSEHLNHTKQLEIDELKSKLEATQVPEGFVLINAESLALHAKSIRIFNNGDEEDDYYVIENHVCAIEDMIEAAQGEGHE
ncbi:hypothetical protein [Acinetobacter sp. ANC 4640]